MQETTNTEATNLLTERLAIIIILALIALVLLVLLWPRSTERPLKPFVPTSTPATLGQNDTPPLVTFAELQEAPTQFWDQRIRVSGRFLYTGVPECQPYSGIPIAWGLVNDNLQMNAHGFESVVRYLPNDTEMTVEGFWRFYSGPLGCGKQPQAQRGLWYLAVDRILQPNPLIVQAGDAGQVQPSGGLPNATVISGDTATAEPTSIIIELTPSDEPEPTVAATNTPLPTPLPGTGTATPMVTNTPTLTNTPLPTPLPGTGTATPTSTATVTPTLENGVAPTPTNIGPPPAPTATPGSGGGYPPPASPSPYP